MNYKKAQILAMKLAKYAEIEGSEIGETCSTLISLVRCCDYVTPEFYTALCKEMKVQLDNFKEHSRIVEREEVKTYRIKELEWENIDY